MLSWMVSSKPVIRAATNMMTLTPSTTPKTVSPLRILWVRNVSIACLRFSPYACAIWFFSPVRISGFGPQCLDGIQFSRARSRINAEEQADRGGQAQRNNYGAQRHTHRDGGRRAHQLHNSVGQ